MVAKLGSVLGRGICIKLIELCGPPPRAAQEFSAEVVAYALTHYKRVARDLAKTQRRHHWLGEMDSDVSDDLDAAADPGRRGHQHGGRADNAYEIFRQQLHDLFRIFNGELWIDCVFIHYCGGRSCCADASVTLQRMRDEARRTLFRIFKL